MTPIRRRRRACSASSTKSALLNSQCVTYCSCLSTTVDEHNWIRFRCTLGWSELFDIHLVGEDVLSISVGVATADIEIRPVIG